jgi:SAM-dependent methyltransferase
LDWLAPCTPISRKFGFDRGLPIDRHYIEGFLDRHAPDIRGRVLEIGDAAYTRRFGGSRVSRSDVLHATPGNPAATLVGDLATGAGVPHDAFDCIVLTQTLPFIYDVRSVIQNVYVSLKPSGVVLATVPGISQISRYDMDRWGDFWRFTPLSARRLFQDAFPEESLSVQSCGNVLAAVAFLHGLATAELRASELAHNDQDYPVIITIRAQKGRAT